MALPMPECDAASTVRARREATPYASLPGGARLYYTDEGAGEPLLFVHGWTCDSNDFLAQLAFFRPRYRVIAPDLRGHGRSSVSTDGYDARVFARDLVELLDRLGVDRVVAIGHSLGGLIVSVLAVEYPTRVRAIVCLDPAYGVDGEGADACRAIVARMSTADWASTLADEFPTWDSASTMTYFRELHVRRMLAMDPTVVMETFRLLFGGDDALGYRERSERYLARRNCPVLAIYARDGRERVEWETRHSRHAADRFLHLPFGHWLQQDAPDLVNQEIDEWLNTLPSAPLS
jgi:pimeloyl-ACP methyl ester carboxylesterase